MFLEHVLIYVYSSLNIYVSIRVLFFSFLNKLGFVCTCMRTYKHIYIYTYTFAGIHVCVYVCAHTYIPTITYTCMCADLYVHMRFVYVHAYIYMWTYMHLCMFICIRTYLSIEICIYTGHWHVTQYFLGHALCPVETQFPLNIFTYNITHEIIKCAFRCIRV